MRRPNFVPRAAPPAGRRIQSLCHLQTSGRQGNPAAQSTSSSRPSVGSGHQQFASPSHCSPTFSRDPSIQSVRLWCVIFFLHISSLDQRAAVWQSWHLTHFLPIRPSPVPQNCPSPSFLYFYQISTDQSQLCKSLIMKCRNLVQEKNAFCIYPKTAQRRDVLGNTSPEDREISRRREFCTTIPEKFFNLRVYAMCMTSAWILSLGMVFVDTLPWECIGKGSEGFCWGGC